MLNKPLVAAGELWRLWTVTLVHAPLTEMPLHLLFNMYFLYLAGPFVERLYGRWTFLALYLLFAVGRVARRRSRSAPAPLGRRRVGRDLRPVRPARRRRAAPPPGPRPPEPGVPRPAHRARGVQPAPRVHHPQRRQHGPHRRPGDGPGDGVPVRARPGCRRCARCGAGPGPTPGTTVPAFGNAGTLAIRGRRPRRARGRDARPVGHRRRGLGLADVLDAQRSLAEDHRGRGRARRPRGGGRGRARRPSRRSAPRIDERRRGRASGVQAAAGLDLVTDGKVRWAEPGCGAAARAGRRRRRGRRAMLVRTWQAASAVDRPAPSRSRSRGRTRWRAASTPTAARPQRTEFTLELAAPPRRRAAGRSRRPAARWR